jgi:hypothetical protein
MEEQAMTPFPNSNEIQTAPAAMPAPHAHACPRCNALLVVVRQQMRSAETITAFMCPSFTCGYKLIVPR